jgi:hypothetical protein
VGLKMSEQQPTVGLSVCTACGEFYRYRGRLHCSPGSPVAVKPRCMSRYDSPRENDECYCACTLNAGHASRHKCCCDERWTDEQADDEINTTGFGGTMLGLTP